MLRLEPSKENVMQDFKHGFWVGFLAALFLIGLAASVLAQTRP